jgi:hypothetical protein
MVNGKKMPSIPMDSVPDTQFISVKFRLRNSSNGTSGSRSWRIFWTSRNAPSSTTPAAMISGMEMNEVTVPQS